MNSNYGKTFQALIKREYWEHRGAMLITPLSIAAFFAVLMLLGIFNNNVTFSTNDFQINFFEHLPKMAEKFDNANFEEQTKIVHAGLYTPMIFFGFVMLVISFFYTLGSLYDERKDRSILFWKSLPISDTSTVLSKFVAVCVLVPVLYFAVIVLFQLYILLFATVAAWFSGSSGISFWAASNLLSVIFNTLMTLIVVSLWLAPIWAWLMFASSWAKKVAFIWGTLPILLISIAEGYLFRSSNFIDMVGERIGNGFVILSYNTKILFDDHKFDIGTGNWYQTFGNMEFWIGLIVSAVFLAGAIYTRRHRDES